MKFKPWEVGRLVPFQVRHILLVERDAKTGVPLLDGPLGGELDEIGDMAAEWRREWRKRGITDPDVLEDLVERALAEDPFGKTPGTAEDD